MDEAHPGLLEPIPELDVVLHRQVEREAPHSGEIAAAKREISAVAIGEPRLSSGRKSLVVSTPGVLARARPAGRMSRQQLLDPADAGHAVRRAKRVQMGCDQAGRANDVVVEEQDVAPPSMLHAEVSRGRLTTVVLNDDPKRERGRQALERGLGRRIVTVDDDDDLDGVRLANLRAERLEARAEERRPPVRRNDDAELRLHPIPRADLPPPTRLHPGRVQRWRTTASPRAPSAETGRPATVPGSTSKTAAISSTSWPTPRDRSSRSTR